MKAPGAGRKRKEKKKKRKREEKEPHCRRFPSPPSNLSVGISIGASGSTDLQMDESATSTGSEHLPPTFQESEE